MTVGQYDAKNLIVTAAGIRIEGFGDGDFISYDPPELFTSVVGSDGLVARAANNDFRVDVTITLLATSPANDSLNAIAQADINNPNGSGVFAFTMSDLFGRFSAAAPECWIKKKPAVTFGREVGSREWVIECAKFTDKVLGS